ncbi:MAG: kynureninase [Acidobacteriota bacterium]
MSAPPATRGPTRADAMARDAALGDLSRRDDFALPPGRLYFDGNSLGPPTRAALVRLETAAGQWRDDLIASWNTHDWIHLPQRVGAKIARLVGAADDEVVVCDSTSVNLFKVLATALVLRPGRRTILCQDDHFPSDNYIADGLAALVPDVEVVRFRCDQGRLEALDAALAAHPAAVVSLGHVGFRDGRLLDMAAVTELVHHHGALALWDLAHSAGALPVDLDACGVDLAVGCGYKFLNGGPGAPAFLYVARRHHDAAETPLPGWLGHADPFAFEPAYRPAAGAARFVCGTPPVLSLAALDAALDVFDGVDLERLRALSLSLGDLFLELAAARLARYGVECACPLDGAVRGAQVVLRHPDADAAIQAAIARGLVGDHRAPDLLRFGLTPLYLRHVDVWDAVEGLDAVFSNGEHRQERFRRRGIVP